MEFSASNQSLRTKTQALKTAARAPPHQHDHIALECVAAADLPELIIFAIQQLRVAIYRSRKIANIRPRDNARKMTISLPPAATSFGADVRQT